MVLRKLFQQIAFILILGSIIGIGANFHLIKKYFQGEFRQSFFSSEKFPSITFITLAEAEELFAAQDAIFIDSRLERDYLVGHILGALNIPFEQREEKDILDQLDFPHGETLVVYCEGSECHSSVELAKILDAQGFKSIKVFFEGWAEWVQAGLPVSIKNDWK